MSGRTFWKPASIYYQEFGIDLTAPNNPFIDHLTAYVVKSCRGRLDPIPGSNNNNNNNYKKIWTPGDPDQDKLLEDGWKDVWLDA